MNMLRGKMIIDNSRFNYALLGLFWVALLFAGPVVAKESDIAANPILTRSAVTVESLSLLANARYFKNVELEEADRFTGYGFDFEVAIPFKESMQFRVLLPAYTRGKARLLKPRTLETITIKGPAGTFDYPTILFDHQLLDVKDHGVNFSYFLGYGRTIKAWGKLDTTHGDIYNHQGHLFRMGVHADGHIHQTGMRWLTNLGLRNYIDSDDLNPADTGDTFFLIDLMAAAVFDSWRGWFHPAIELVYQGDVDRYHALHLVPQIIVQVSRSVDLKAGVLMNLSGHGEDFGTRLQVSYRR
jgi:hypothetical protein